METRKDDYEHLLLLLRRAQGELFQRHHGQDQELPPEQQGDLFEARRFVARALLQRAEPVENRDRRVQQERRAGGDAAARGDHLLYCLSGQSGTAIVF